MIAQKTLTIATRGRGTYDITGDVEEAVHHSGVRAGLCHVFVQHTSASLMLCENADPDVCTDFSTFLAKLVPESRAFRHMEGNSDSHIKASLMGFSATIPVSRGRLVLGTWQGIYFCEFDGPRTRKFHVTVMG